ncbi:MAG: ATP-dependent phosphofructokinase / diphosphate-dependent phosphofructokinase [Thermoanaerobacterium sp.]|nr:ATP-dependent phosphofructokinase / diphosphate-dependent phosphofructokinase [Thermoanaerobacterium sp.]
MKSVKGNLLIAQSGGPTSVINASAYGAIKEFLSLGSGHKVYAGVYGIQGILEKRIIDIDTLNKNTIETLKYMPSSAFGSCRYKLKDYDENEEEYEKIINIFKKFNIRYFLYIGGNDSMDTANKLSIYMNKIGYDANIIGVPKTIDNDLVETDHCPGFGSAAKYVTNIGIEIWSDINAYKKESIMIMEVMGRDAGWIAASTGILKSVIPDINQLIYLPEISFDKDKFLIDVEKAIKKNNKLLIVVSEGIKDENGEYINANKNEIDSFGHKQLGGAGRHLQNLIKENITKNVKLIELGVTQRCAIHCASKTDIEESEIVGRDSVKYVLAGYSGYMTALERSSNDKYNCVTKLVKLQDVCNRVKNVPLNWINEQKNSVKDAMIDYIQPLILGEINPFNENGLVKYTDINFFR